MDVIEKKISNLIENQFPQIYQEEGEGFVRFVTEYYKWLESSNNSIYLARNFLEFRDVDETTDQFLIFIKEKYLKNIQLETNTNTRQLIKHSLDLYRSKGTPRSVDLLFRLVFGVGANVYLPSDDIFTLSEGKWYVPIYLEVTPLDINDQFQNKQIQGLKSGAKAFVEAVVRKVVKGKFVDLFYISALKGHFEYGEIINTTLAPLKKSECPTLIGSLNEIELDVNGAGSDFKKGDIVDVTSDSGDRAKARVGNVSTITGLVNLKLIEGGYGYANNAEVLISEKVLSLSNVTIGTNTFFQRDYFDIFEMVTQKFADLNYLNSNTTWNIGDLLYTYHANNDLKGIGRVLTISTVNSTAGNLFVHVSNGTVSDNTIFKASNTGSANISVIDGFFDKTATANVIGVSSNLTIAVSGATGTFVVGEKVYQTNTVTNANVAVGTIVKFENIVGSNASINLIENEGLFYTTKPIRGASSNATANVTSLAFDIGVIDINNAFLVTNNEARVIGAWNGATGVLTSVSTGTGASFEISPDVLYGEFIDINPDYLRDYANVALNANTYGFPGNATANLTSGILFDIFTFVNTEIGKVSTLIGVNKGQNYNKSPFVSIYQPGIFEYRTYSEQFLTLANSSGNFEVGETINQGGSSNGRALVIATTNSSFIKVQKLRISPNNALRPTTNTLNIILGENSGVTANVISAIDDPLSPYQGFNAVVEAPVNVGNGAIVSLTVTDSGFGFVDGQVVNFQTKPGNRGTGFAKLLREGRGSGFYKNDKSFLSNTKKLLDSDYYQDFSYEVQSSISIAKYKEMLHQVLHVAGMKPFGALYYDKTLDATANIEYVEIEQTEDE